MSRIIKVFPDNTFLCFDSGKFDEWCVYLTKPNGKVKAPSDKQYFGILSRLSRVYTPEMVYGHFVSIYDLTEKEPDKSTLLLIDELAMKYGKHSLLVQKVLTTIYATMISEQNKKYTKLGKRIKRLGLHQVLIERVDYGKASVFSRGMKWKQLDAECRKRGF